VRQRCVDERRTADVTLHARSTDESGGLRFDPALCAVARALCAAIPSLRSADGARFAAVRALRSARVGAMLPHRFSPMSRTAARGRAPNVCHGPSAPSDATSTSAHVSLGLGARRRRPAKARKGLALQGATLTPSAMQNATISACYDFERGAASTAAARSRLPPNPGTTARRTGRGWRNQRATRSRSSADRSGARS
jgi:hypothetical protein